MGRASARVIRGRSVRDDQESPARENGGLKPALPGIAALALAFAGCATPGPLHVYSLPAVGAEHIADRGDHGAWQVPSFVGSDEKVTGFAYDPFTDHFFLRLEPGYRIRVVDRPARAIKREFTIEDALPKGGGDLAVRPRDGHLFLLEPDGVLETTRLGKLVRMFSLAGIAGRPAGLAYDATHDRLLVLAADGARVTRHDMSGARAGELTLEEPAGPSLGFDADRRELFAPLRARPGEVGVFDENGRLLRTAPAAGALVDVGQRSLVRVF